LEFLFVWVGKITYFSANHINLQFFLFIIMDKKKVYEEILYTAKTIAKEKDGALFVIADESKLKGLHEPLYPQVLGRPGLHHHGMDKVLEKLAVLDGATLLTPDGRLLAYGSRLKKSIPLPGYGTKHAAAVGITTHLKDSTAILVSEESHWIKVFKKGQMVLQMDAEENPKSLNDKIVSFLSEGDTALLTAAGVSAAVLGAAAFVPVTVVGGTYLAIKTATGMIKKNWNQINFLKKY